MSSVARALSISTRDVPRLAARQRRLELEVSDPLNLQDDGRTAKTTKPGDSVSQTGPMLRKRCAPAPSPIAPKTPLKKDNDTSLGFLTQRFTELLSRTTDGVLDLNIVARELCTSKRRVYDVTNVLEGIKLIKKKSKNMVEWLGGEVNAHMDEELRALVEEERRLDELIQSCTLQDVQRIPSLKEQTVIVIKAPAETTLEVPHPEESLQVHLRSTQGPIKAFLCTNDPIPMETSDSSGASGANGSYFNISANGTNSAPLVPYPAFVQVSAKDKANRTSGISRTFNPLSEPTQHTTHDMHTSLQPSSEEQQSFVTLTPPLACSVDGEQHLVNLAEDQGITDLFSSVDLDHSHLP
ncbi:hypothetical protein ABVT39_004122 [Epinephelus coioides]